MTFQPHWASSQALSTKGTEDRKQLEAGEIRKSTLESGWGELRVSGRLGLWEVQLLCAGGEEVVGPAAEGGSPLSGEMWLLLLLLWPTALYPGGGGEAGGHPAAPARAVSGCSQGGSGCSRRGAGAKALETPVSGSLRDPEVPILRVSWAPTVPLPCPSVALPAPADLQGPTSYRVIQISSFANSSWAQNQGSGWLGDVQIHGWDADAGRAVFLKPWSKGNFSDEEMVELEEIIQVYLTGFILEVQDHAPEFQMQCESRPLGSRRGLPGPSLPLLQAAAPWELPPTCPPALHLGSRCSL